MEEVTLCATGLMTLVVRLGLVLYSMILSCFNAVWTLLRFSSSSEYTAGCVFVRSRPCGCVFYNVWLRYVLS